jgi:hypothetical protein
MISSKLSAGRSCKPLGTEFPTEGRKFRIILLPHYPANPESNHGDFMAKKKYKSEIKIIGIALILAGIGLAFWAYQISGSVGSQLNRTFNGSFSEAEMIRYIGGAACALVGIYLVIKK